MLAFLKPCVQECHFCVSKTNKVEMPDERIHSIPICFLFIYGGREIIKMNSYKCLLNVHTELDPTPSILKNVKSEMP